MELDTASLFVHRDTDSFITRMTDNLSKLSVVFTFDRELFISKVYERAFRGSVKESLKLLQKDDAKAMKRSQATDRRPEGSVKESFMLCREDIDALKKSQALDRQIEEDWRQLRRECKVLVLGSEDSGKDRIIKKMKIIQNGYFGELEMYRHTIYKNLTDSIRSIILAMQQFEIEPEKEENKSFCATLMEYSVPEDPYDVMGRAIGDAISSIWSDPCIPKVMERSYEFCRTGNAE